MSFFDESYPDMDRYLEAHCSQEPALLLELRKETHQKTTQPHMISGSVQGRLLSIISRILCPEKILEIGTFTGYSALCLAEGLRENGRLITLDINEDQAYLPKKYFLKSPFSHQIEYKLEEAAQFLKTNKEIFDLIFIDADKENYVEYFSLIKPFTKKGSVVVFDNVLWYGKVLEIAPKSKSTQVIQRLNQCITQDTDFENMILPLRDGLHLLIRK
ncbi:MAG: O-methyltransferase [Bergeyella sp.]|nr:O-methyltransferase [Bergeyella sp.]